MNPASNRILQLQEQIRLSKALALDDTIKLVKTLNPNATDEQAREAAIDMLNVVSRSSEDSVALHRSLDKCKTQDEIDEWRRVNQI